jgi:hypothetical protein
VHMVWRRAPVPRRRKILRGILDQRSDCSPSGRPAL